MNQDRTEWAGFHRAALSRPSRELLRRTLGCFQLEKTPPGVAVDLGCGSGADTLEMLRCGWTVHAVDADTGGIQMLEATVPAELKGKLFTHALKFEDFQFPLCSLIWAGYSLPFCPSGQWLHFWERICAALDAGGRMSGDIFGDKHAFASETDVMTISEADLRELIRGKNLLIEAFDIENGVRPSGGEITRWHAFGITVRRPAAGVDA